MNEYLCYFLARKRQCSWQLCFRMYFTRDAFFREAAGFVALGLERDIHLRALAPVSVNVRCMSMSVCVCVCCIGIKVRKTLFIPCFWLYVSGWMEMTSYWERLTCLWYSCVREHHHACVGECVCLCVSVCVWRSEREMAYGRESQTGHLLGHAPFCLDPCPRSVLRVVRALGSARVDITWRMSHDRLTTFFTQYFRSSVSRFPTKSVFRTHCSRCVCIVWPFHRWQWPKTIIFTYIQRFEFNFS